MTGIEKFTLSSVFHQIPAGLIIIEVSSGQVIFGNNKLANIWKYPGPPGTFINHYQEWKGFHPHGSPYQPEEWPFLRSLSTGEIVCSEEVDILRYDGSIGTICICSSPIRNEQGKIIASAGLLFDISEYRQIDREMEHYHQQLEKLVDERTIELLAINKQLQEKIQQQNRIEMELRESENKYSTLVEQSIDGVAIVQEGLFSFVNKAVSRSLGYEELNLVGRSFLEVISPECREMISQRYKARMQGEVVPSFYETKTITKTGEIRIVEISIGLIQYKGRPATLVTIRDVTERKRVEEEQQRIARLEAIEVLASGIAHDFNNILTGIIGNISLAKLYINTEDEVYTLLNEAERSSLLARDLTQQLLTFSKEGVLVKKKESIVKLLEDTVTFTLRGSKVASHFSFPKDLWSVEIDEGQIHQVVNNLIINAKQAMPEGGEIWIKAENVMVEDKPNLPLAEGYYVKISIRDQGVGIPEEYLQKIFDPYFTTKEDGNGLGLATTHAIIKKHAGYITVESVVGVGSTFYLYLPAVKSSPLVLAKREEEIHQGQGRILFMDNEEYVREAGKSMLAFLGYEVELAADGAEVISIFAKSMAIGHPFSAVIMDLTIPGGMGGQETIRELLNIDPEVKAIVSSGYGHDPIVSDYQQYGFCGRIIKPYRVHCLSEVLHKVIEV